MKNSKIQMKWLASVAPVLALVTGCMGASEEAAAEDQDLLASHCNPQVPPAIAAPAGNKLAFSYDAAGVQIYDCAAAATGFAWVFRAPEATLYGRNGRVAATHFAGPTWRSTDGSSVVAAKAAEFAASPDAIPWLLLRATSHDGAGRMANVTYVQRLETVGGKAPATGCDATTAGAVARVDYAATYSFYEAAPAK